jgi:rod shape-determining protein MreD
VDWQHRIRLGLLIVTGVVLQTTLFPDVRVLGVAPDVGLVLTIAVAYRAGPETGAICGFANGIAIDLFLQTPFGLSALVFAFVGYGIGIVQSGLVHQSRWAPLVLGGLGGLAGGLLFVVIGGLIGQEQLVALRSLRVIVLAGGYDAVLALAVFPLAKWATGEPLAGRLS